MQEKNSESTDELLIDPKLHIPVDEYIEEGPGEDGEKIRRKGVYLLPNLFTTAALFAGFYAIVSATYAPMAIIEDGVAAGQEYFIYSAIAIFIAMIMDGLDGRVARLTNTQSAFGAEYDSLSDMVAFGIAPALLAFQWSLSNAGKIGWMIAFIYVACTALRLARFNTQIGSADKKYFIGLASPSAAAVVAGAVWAFSKLGIAGEKMIIPMLALVLMAGVLMVSNIKYYSFKTLNLKGRIPFVGIIVIVLCFAIIGNIPSYILVLMLLLLLFGYTISGPALYLMQLKKRNLEQKEVDKN